MARESGQTMMLAAIIFAFVVASLGGSSRYDLVQGVLLQPFACLAAGYCLIKAWDANWDGLRVLLYALLAWTVLTVLQLVPLPPSIWHLLPGREPMVAIANAIGDDRWRPLSMAPWRTQNALWSLAVPLASLFLFAALKASRVNFVLLAIIAIALVSALLGIVQITLGSDNPFYTYAVTSQGAAVGLFANRNHAAVFTAMVIILIAAVAKLAPRPMPAWQAPALGASFFLMLIFQFINGSRAGLGLTVVAVVFAGLMFVQRTSRTRKKARRTSRILQGLSGDSRLAVAGFGMAIFLAAVFYYSDRLPGIERIAAETNVADLRYQLLPILQHMAWDYFPWGSGFGSFENVYYIHEPSELLDPAYLNQAHNDLLQTIIEGGLPGLAIVLFVLAWLARGLWRLVRHEGRARVIALAGTGVAIVVFAASGVDYPLRTALFQMACVWLLCAFAIEIKRYAGGFDSGQGRDILKNAPDRVDGRVVETNRK